MLVRRPTWETSLSRYFDDANLKTFKWGAHDCALFAAGAVEAMTGVDFAAPFRGRYSDAAGSVAALKEFGSGTLHNTVTSALGRHKHVAQAKRGDVVMYEGALGICCGKFSRFIGGFDESGQPLVADGMAKISGLIPIPTAMCKRAWTVAF